MRIFNGVITITSSPQEISTKKWSFDISFKSSDGFLISDIMVDDVVFLNGYDINSDTSRFGRFVVKAIEDSTTLGQKKLTVELTEDLEPGAIVYAPYDGEENRVGLIGRMTSPSGFTFLPTTADGIPEYSIGKSRNIDFKTRDTEFTKYVTKEVQRNGGGASGGGSGTDTTKLPLTGGTISGDLTVENQTTLNKTRIQAGDNVINVTSNGIETTLSGSNITDTKTVSSDLAIDASESRVSTGRKVSYTNLMKGSEAERNTRTNATNEAVNKVEVKSESGTASHVVNVLGTTTNIQLNSQGTTASIELTATEGNVNLTGKTVNVNGDLKVTKPVTVSANVIGDKLFSSSTDENFVDNQLVTKKAASALVTSAINEKLNGATLNGVSRSDVEAMLSGYLTISTANTVISSALSGINPNNIMQDVTHKFVTTDQINEWNNKQDAIDVSTLEKTAKKGLPGGYVPLDDRGKILVRYLDIPQYNELQTPVPVIDEEEYQRRLNGNPISDKPGKFMGDFPFSLFILTKGKSETNPRAFKEWRLMYIHRADADEVTRGEADAEGQQLPFEFEFYSKTSKLVTWSGIDGIPNTIVYKEADGKISESLLPDNVVTKTGGKIAEALLPEIHSDIQTVNGMKFDKYGRYIGQA